MRNIDPATLTALQGSRPTDTLTVWAWRGNQLVVDEPLQIIDWSETDTASDQSKVKQQMSFTVADPDGTLGAWRFDDPLGVAGTELQVIYRVGGAGAVNFARLRVIDNEPNEVVEWRTLPEYGLEEPDSDIPAHERLVPVVKGVVKLQAVDRTYNADRDKLEGPESPGALATALGEFSRLTRDYFPVVVDPGVTDIGISRLTVFDRERLDACQDLASRVGARYRMGGDGECHVYPRLTDPVWRVEPRNGLVSVSRKQSIDGLFNRWVVEGKDAVNGAPVRVTVSIDTGPLKFGGDHGRAQTFYTSEMITSGDQAEAYGVRQREEFLASLAVELTVTTVPRPELQAGDRIEVGYPLPAGHVAYFLGTINAIRRQGTNVPGYTTLTVACSYTDVIQALGRTEWAEHITGNLPDLTWERMPANWGTLPDLTWNDLP